MAVKTESTIIDDVEYSVTQWSCEKALTMKFKLTKILGPALAKLAATDSTGGEGNNSQQLAAFGEALQALFMSAEPEEVVKLIKECLVGVARDGKRMTEHSINEFFTGDDLFSIYKVFGFVIKVNFSGFMKGQWADKLLASVKDKL